MMDSSFLTGINVGLGLYSGISFLKLMVQFGLPNHPGRFTAYLVSLCAASYFGMQALTDLGYLTPHFFIRWRTLPIVAGSLAILLQIIMTVGQFSRIQQKIVSRMPLIVALLFYAFFPQYAEWFFALCLLVGCIFLTISVGKARYQKRMFFKMVLFVSLFGAFLFFNQYWAYVVGKIFIFFALFYFFILEQTFGISAMIEGHEHSLEGAAK